MRRSQPYTAVFYACLLVGGLVMFILFRLMDASQDRLVTSHGPAVQGAEVELVGTPVSRPVSPTVAVAHASIGAPVTAVSFDGDVSHLPHTAPPSLPFLPEPQGPHYSNPREPGVMAADSVLQSRAGSLSMPAASQNFAGLNKVSNGNGWPPDTNGDVGPNNYIQAVNTSIGIYSKTGTQQAAFSFNTFFSSAANSFGTGTLCDTSNQGDPIVLYDAISGRWIVTDFAWTDLYNGPYYQCIAVSKTSNPLLGGWWMYAFLANNLYMHDYEKLSVWSDGIYMSANLFDFDSGGSVTWQGAQVWAFNRSDLISGILTSVTFTSTLTNEFGLLPSNLRGSLPLAGTPNYLIEIWNYDYLGMYKFHVDWITPTNSTLTGPFLINVAHFDTNTGSIPESGGNALDPINDRFMMQLQYRYINGIESLWATHTVDSGSVTGIRWYEIRNLGGSSPTVYQQGTYQPDAIYRWLPGLAVDRFGNMAVGYSASSSGMFPAIRYAGRLVTDTLGTLGQGETTLIAGTGAQNNTCGGYPCGRWGDYSAMTVDPTDDCTFWYTNEYYASTGSNWQTRIGSFKYPSCGSDSLALTLSPGAVIENAANPAATGTVTRITPDLTSALVVTLTNSLPLTVTVPATLTIPISQTVAIFPITVVTDGVSSTLTANIGITATGFLSSNANLIIFDAETVKQIRLPLVRR